MIMIKKSVLIWLAIIPLAVLNGFLREEVIVPLIGLKYALPVSGMALCLLIFLVTLTFLPRIGKGNGKTYRNIGIVWVILTVVFEFAMGLFAGYTFGELLNAYDITTGNLWLLVVVFTGAAPWLVAKLKRII